MFHHRIVSLLPILFLYPRAMKRLHKERARHPILVIAVPLILMIAGMVLNSIGLSFDQPPSASRKIRRSDWQRKGSLSVNCSLANAAAR